MRGMVFWARRVGQGSGRGQFISWNLTQGLEREAGSKDLARAGNIILIPDVHVPNMNLKIRECSVSSQSVTGWDESHSLGYKNEETMERN